MRFANVITTALASATVLAPVALSAQSNSDFAAATALATTPVGAFAPHITNAMLDDEGFTRLAFEYGKVNTSDAPHSLGGRIDLGYGGGNDLTFEVGQTTCSGCSSITIFGAGGGFHVGSMAMGSDNSAKATLGLTGDVGYWSKSGTSAWSVAVGVPLSLVVKSGTVAFVPFVKPSIGWGRLSGNNFLGGSSSESGTRAMIGGGVGVVMPKGFGATVGLQRVIVDNTENVIGADVSWAF